MKEHYNIEFEELEFIRTSAPQIYENLSERFRKYAIANSDNREATLKEMFQDDQYMIWLATFMEQYEMFDTENWLEIEERLESEDVINIYRLELFVEIVQTCLHEKNWKIASLQHTEACTLVYGADDDMYQLQRTEYFNGQNMIYGVDKIDRIATDELDICTIRYDDVKEYVENEILGKYYQR